MSQAEHHETRDQDIPYCTLRWLDRIDPHVGRAFVELIDATTSDGGTLGYRQAMSTEQADAFNHGLQQAIEQGRSHALLGENAQGAVVCFAMMTRSGMPNCHHLAELTKGVVHPRDRGRGLVQQALGEIVQRARQIGVEQLTLDVREGTRAHRLWSRLGLVSFGVLEDYARVDGIHHRGHFMAQRVEHLATHLGLN